MRITRWLSIATSALALQFGSYAIAAPTPTSLQVSVNPSSVALGGDVTVTGTVVTNPVAAINCGAGDFQYQLLRDGDPLIAGFQETVIVNWSDFGASVAVSANQFGATFNTNMVSQPVLAGDKVRFRARYNPSGGGCAATGVGYGQSPTVDLLIVDSVAAVCPNNQTTGVWISIEDAFGDGTPPPGTKDALWAYNVKVKACEAVSGVTAQGGSNSWTAFQTWSATTGAAAIRNTNDGKNRNGSNSVLLWTIGDMALGQLATLTVTSKGSIKAGTGECGKTKLLNGDWSAMFSNDGGQTRQKSDYTTYVSTVTVTCN